MLRPLKRGLILTQYRCMQPLKYKTTNIQTAKQTNSHKIINASINLIEKRFTFRDNFFSQINA